MPRPALVAVLLLSSAASAQTDSLASRYAVYMGGERSDLDAVVDAAAGADVVFLGERHDDPVAHALQLRVLQGVRERAGRPVALGLEMFEADVQPVLDEYLAGAIEERDFLAASRPWSNYADYRPLVEYAREHGLPVVATNAPARHVRLVAREGGAGALDRLPEASLAVYPPRPWASPSDALAAAFAEAMSGMAGHGGPSAGGMLAAQNLRDLTMAWRTAEAARGALVVHVNGSFHSAGGRGIPEHLARFAPDARVLVVTFEPAADLAAPPAEGGVVVRTRARS